MKKNLIRRRRRGAALVEYGLIVSGVALISAAAVAIFGHKTNDLIAAMATVLPGAHADDNGSIASGKIIETTPAGAAGGTGASINMTAIANNSGSDRLAINVLGAANAGTGDSFGGLVVEANPAPTTP